MIKEEYELDDLEFKKHSEQNNKLKQKLLSEIKVFKENEDFLNEYKGQINKLTIDVS